MLKQSVFSSGFKLFLLPILFALSSCLGNNTEGPSEIRIVDLNGNPKPVKRFVPEGNAQILANQNIEANKNNISTPVNEKLVQNNNPAPIIPISSIAEPSPAQSTTLASQNNRSEAMVSYDMSNDQTKEVDPKTNDNLANPQTSSNKKFKLAIATSKAPSTKAASSAVSNNKSSGIFIQIGSFSVADNANKILTKSKKISKGKVEEVETGDKKSYRVLLGPIPNTKKANIILKQAKHAGYKDAFIIK